MSGPTNGGRARHLQALRESEELHRATLSAISDTVLLADDQGAFIFICPNVDVIFGYTPDEVQAFGTIAGFLGPDLFDPDDLIARGELHNIEREISTKSGERRAVLIHLKRVSIKGGTVLVSCRDVTELKLAERELALTRLNLTHAARLTLVGQLLATIVHEVQQPLVSIRLNASAAINALDDRALDDWGATRASLSDIHSAAVSANDMIIRLRNLARKKPIEMAPLDLNEAIADVLNLIRSDLVRRGVVVRTELAAELPAILADRVSLQQVVLDLAINAMEAMSDTNGERLLEIRTLPGKDVVEIIVADNGSGVAPEHRLKLFDPFFTTKPEGMGLGLSTAQSILGAHGGHIRIQDDKRQGASFCITLPAAAG